MKKSMKRIGTLLLALTSLLSMLTLAACGGDSVPKYVFKSGEMTLYIGQKAADVVDSLPTNAAVESSPSCGDFPGTDYVYPCEGFIVYTTPGAKENVINKIELTSDAVKTPEGLMVGSSRADVEKAMGSVGSDGENTDGVSTLEYTDGGVRLQIIMRENTVTGISYLVANED